MVHEPTPGTRLAERFELRQIAAQTPAYVEYRALDREIGVEVGLWWMRPGLCADPARQDQLLGAAVELRRFAHPGVRKLHGAGPLPGGVWVSWQIATGRGPLLMSRAAGATGAMAPIELPSLLRWLDVVCGALAALHAVGIVHGRLIPEDVVVVAGEWKLGGAGLLTAIDPVAAQAVWVRHQGLVAPELRAGARATAATDAWSVAAIAAAMVGGSDGPDDAMRVVARRHPPLHDLFAAVLGAAPGARVVDLLAFAAEARTRAAMPYLADDRTGPMRAMRVLAAAAPPPVARPLGHRPHLDGRKVAAPDEPTTVDPAQRARPITPAPGDGDASRSFGLPTPSGVPPAPVAHPPAVAIHRAASPAAPTLQPVAPPDVTSPVAPPRDATPPPRARTVPPPGGFQVVSMKPADPRPPTAPVAAPAGKGSSGRAKQPRLRAISEASPRKFSVAPGALGYLAPPRDVVEARERAARRRRMQAILIALVLAAAAVGGYVLARI